MARGKARSKIPVKCGVDVCTRLAEFAGYCSPHYRRMKKYGDPTKGQRTIQGEALRWILSHLHHNGDECLIWPFLRAKRSGRGRATYKRRRYNADHLMCLLRHGPPPTPEHECAHSCGKGHKGCINPNHLRWRTHAENMSEMVLHGNSHKGIRSPLAKLNEDDVLDIYRRAWAGERQEDIAGDYGINCSNVSTIKHGRSWSHLLHKDAAE